MKDEKKETLKSYKLSGFSSSLRQVQGKPSEFSPSMNLGQAFILHLSSFIF
jgi:hypothetical protein